MSIGLNKKTLYNLLFQFFSEHFLQNTKSFKNLIWDEKDILTPIESANSVKNWVDIFGNYSNKAYLDPFPQAI